MTNANSSTETGDNDQSTPQSGDVNPTTAGQGESEEGATTAGSDGPDGEAQPTTQQSGEGEQPTTSGSEEKGPCPGQSESTTESGPGESGETTTTGQEETTTQQPTTVKITFLVTSFNHFIGQKPFGLDRWLAR